MAYVKMKIGEFIGQKTYQILLSRGYTMSQAQKLCDKGRLIDKNGVALDKNSTVNGELFFIDYECKPVGIKPIFECDEFGVFDKPSGVLTHPNGRYCNYSLCDEIWTLWGKNASVAHRLDKETSGVIVVGKSIETTKKLKAMFESRCIFKSYLALVSGKVQESKFQRFAPENYMDFVDKFSFINDDNWLVIDRAMDITRDYDDIKIRMQICDNGKRAITLFRPIEFDEKINATLVECIPLTGRQHQLRLHLFYVKHKILGDPIYGLERCDIERILDGKMSENERIEKSGANRLMLHSNRLKFNYNGTEFDISSKMKFGLSPFAQMD
ncbi:RluA family pseudouridine synthase [uncultured Campylobacter sp.]|uniref:pseudouridine synthase family protein n=1 Tax=uncultured Campylobacter sp. TaxID=218934 RepID=UPI002628FC6D|nr:RluA family pseudouridine synthase [uncultured Campylobacter sp.]